MRCVFTRFPAGWYPAGNEPHGPADPDGGL